MDIDEIRRANLRALEAELGSMKALADKTGMSYTQCLNYRNGALDSRSGKKRGMRKETAWRFEDAGKKPRGWLDQDHSGETIETLTHTLARQIEAASPEVQSAIMALLMSYQTDQARGDETARAIKTLLGVRNGDPSAG